MSKGNLLWAFDESEGSFSPLPASPLLIPGLIILALIRVFGGSGARVVPAEELLPPHILQSAEYQRDCARYRFLHNRLMATGRLEDLEWIERAELQHPRWRAGRRWFYNA